SLEREFVVGVEDPGDARGIERPAVLPNLHPGLGVRDLLDADDLKHAAASRGGGQEPLAPDHPFETTFTMCPQPTAHNVTGPLVSGSSRAVCALGGAVSSSSGRVARRRSAARRRALARTCQLFLDAPIQQV